MMDRNRHLAVDDRQLDELWSSVDERLERRRRFRVRATIAGVVAMLLVASLGGGLLVARSGRRGPTELRLAGGAAVPALLEGSGRVLAFDDGSEVGLEREAHVEVLENSARAVGLALRRGAVDVHVQAGGERTWTIETHLVTVQVIGTRFRVEHDMHSVRVAVTEGVVLVRGESLPGRVRRLRVGESVTVDEPAPAPAAAPAPAPAPAPARAAARHEVHAPPPPVAPESRATLLARADETRRRADYRSAATLYREIVDRWPTDAEAGLVAFTLARLEAEQLASPAAAARAFERALALGLPTALTDEAALRRFDSWNAAGDTSAARRAALDYLLRHPTSESAPRLRAYLESSPH